jgi:succinoglycan biosynthesis protein ExoA
MDSARGPTGAEHWAPVSVIMPVRDDARHLEQSVGRVLANGYPGELEVVLAVGPSRDEKENVARGIGARHPCVVVVPNPTGRTPAGLNAAISASRHPVVVRVDAHGFLPAGYIARAVRLLEDTGAANVGGLMVPVGSGPFQVAVARAMSSPLGMGSAPFHVGGSPGPVESVYLGTFRRDVLDAVGGFDESLPRAQDWELNHRIRLAGGTVWFHPDLWVRYRPRRSWSALVRQFHGSGQWRRAIVGRHPRTASLRYLAAPLAVVGVVGGTLAGVVGVVLEMPLLRAGALLPLGYAGVVLVGSVVEGRGLPAGARLLLPAVIATMHLAWGAGFLGGPPSGSTHPTRPPDTSPPAAPRPVSPGVVG